MASPHECLPSPFGAPVPRCFVFDVYDVLVVLSGWYSGVIPLCTKPLSPKEKRKYIVSGWTVIFPPALSPVKRWRDHFFWSTSRIVGPFFLYRQYQEPGRPGPPISKSTKRPVGRRALRPVPAPELSPEDEEAWDNTEFAWWLVGSGKKSPKLTRGGYCRKSITVELFGCEYRVVSYYSLLDAHRRVLPRASEHDKLAGLGIHPAILNGARCKMNSRTVSECLSLSEWLPETSTLADVDSPRDGVYSSDMESEDALCAPDEAGGQEVPAEVSDRAESGEQLAQIECEERSIESEDDERLSDARDDVESEDAFFDAPGDAGSENSLFDPRDAEEMPESTVAVPVEENDMALDFFSDVDVSDSHSSVVDTAHIVAPAATPSPETIVHGLTLDFDALSSLAQVSDVDPAVVSALQAHVDADIFDCLQLDPTSEVRQASPMDFGELLSSTLSQPDANSVSRPSTTGVCQTCGQSTIFSQARGGSSAASYPLPESELLTVAQFLDKFFPECDPGA